MREAIHITTQVIKGVRVMQTADASPTLPPEGVGGEKTLNPVFRTCSGCGNEYEQEDLYGCASHLLCETCAVLWQNLQGWS
jgi:hypothetical protein